MPKLSQGAKDRLSAVIGAGQFVFHWGFIPYVLYLGFSKGADAGMAELSLTSLLWHA